MISTSDIVKKLSEAIEKKLPIKPKKELIIHIDCRTQFTSQAYNEFIKKRKGFVAASMSRINVLKDNAVVERFICTFKEHKISKKTFQQELFYQIEINSKFKGYRKIFNLYIKSLNLKPNLKSNKKSPKKHDFNSSVASQLIIKPRYSKAFSERYGPNYRRDEIDQFKLQNIEVINILDEIAIKRAEVVGKILFDVYESNLALKIIDDCLKAVYELIQNNFEVTRQYVEEAILPI